MHLLCLGVQVHHLPHLLHIYSILTLIKNSLLHLQILLLLLSQICAKTLRIFNVFKIYQQLPHHGATFVFSWLIIEGQFDMLLAVMLVVQST